MAAIGCCGRPADGRHAQDLARARDVLVLHPRNPVRAQHHAHLLQHVAVVVDPGPSRPIAVEDLADWRATRDAVRQLATLTIGALLAVTDVISRAERGPDDASGRVRSIATTGRASCCC
jgi:hypothetical protein